MFYTTSERYLYSLVYSVAKREIDKAPADLELRDFQRAYRRWTAARQPAIPPRGDDGARPAFVRDEALEKEILAPLTQPSPLDDLAHYGDPNMLEVASDRPRIEADVAFVEEHAEKFHALDPRFWDVFDLFASWVMCVDSARTTGGTSSAALGVIYLSDPRRLRPKELYELLVHETTHLAMFVDETRRSHYASYALLPVRENFSVSAIYELARPLDKVLHSLVVATEVLLHREHVLGHDGPTGVHPPSPILARTATTAANELLALQAKRTVLAPRGVALVEQCLVRLDELRPTIAPLARTA